MPILPAQTELSPETIFELSPREWPWSVAHVRSRQEKVLARHLQRHSIPFYLPTVTLPATAGKRRSDSHVPLFPGYVFHRVPDTCRSIVYRSNVIANMIEVPDQAELNLDLQQLRRLQLSGASLTPFEEFLPGESVKITAGVFEGYRGMVVRQKGQTRFVVQVHLIRQAVAVEFPREVLKKTT